MNKLFFVGERRSELAKQNGWHWRDGHLAGKQLFDALREANIDPEYCRFGNWFELRGRAAALRHLRHGGVLIAMGRLVDKALTRRGIPHVYMVHPAARGAIRKKSRYVAHVIKTLVRIKDMQLILKRKGGGKLFEKNEPSG